MLNRGSVRALGVVRRLLMVELQPVMKLHDETTYLCVLLNLKSLLSKPRCLK